jgi:hypothetical protein
MVAYSVTGITNTSATLANAPSTGCLDPGDSVLLVHLQGSGAATTNIGQHELLNVASVSDSTVTFAAAKTRFYGAGTSDDTNVGIDLGQQRVALVRVPQYGDVTVPAGTSLTARPWNGLLGGVLTFHAVGTVTIEGRLHMDGAGYRGAGRTVVVSTSGAQGESYRGTGAAATQVANAGGGGGGRGDDAGRAPYGNSGGGGGHFTGGAPGGDVTCSGAGGTTYGDPSLVRFTMGSGGGAGGTDDFLDDNPPGGYGGAGGGAILVWANSVTIATGGSLSAVGAAGEGDVGPCSTISTINCWDFSGPGGGGAGGTVKLVTPTLTGGSPAIQGGVGGFSYPGQTGDGGNGGNGQFQVQSMP